MNENIPPVPTSAAGQGAPTGQPQPHGVSAPYMQQPYAQQQGGYWVPGTPARKASGFRIAAGIIAIVLGLWQQLPSFSFFFLGSTAAVAMGVLMLAAAWGSIAAGIVLLAKCRSRRPGAPIAVMALAGLALLTAVIGLSMGLIGIVPLIATVVLVAPIMILLGMGLAREKAISTP